MEINLLVVGLNNSRTAIGTFVAGNLEYVTRIPHGSRGDWQSKITDAFSHIKGRDNAAIAVASVNPPLEQPLGDAILQATGIEPQWVGRDIELPIKVRTQSPEKTGIDRILNIAAAHEQMGKACVVVDAGTAITIDVCNDEGDFLGGAIAPGVALQLDALHDHTAQLPRIAFTRPTDELVGQSTEQAILQGVYHGIRGMVKEVIENYATSLGQWPELIATGGDADALFKGWELVHAIAPDLSLYGIALAYANHHIKHET